LRFGEGKLRCFVAIELDPAIKDQLGQVQRQLAGLGKLVRWVDPKQVHLTLKFLGEVPDEKVPQISRTLGDVAAELAPFEMNVAGLGCFPPAGSVRVVWIGVEDPTGRLHECQQRCDQALERLGFPREARPFTPHLTIARARGPRAPGDVRTSVEQVRFAGGSQYVDQIVLFQSHLSPRGAIYTVVSRARLGGGDG